MLESFWDSYEQMSAECWGFSCDRGIQKENANSTF